MGGGGGGWNRSDYHNWDEETEAAASSRRNAEYHRRLTGDALNKIYTELDYEQTRIQNNAFGKEMKAMLYLKDIEWSIFEQEVKKAQANYIANLYTNRIILELKNLEDVVNPK